MDESLGDCDDTVYLDDEAAVAGALDFQDNSFMPLERTGGQPHLCTLGEIELVGLEIQACLIVIGCGGNEEPHLAVRDSAFLTGTCIHHVLEVGNLHI